MPADLHTALNDPNVVPGTTDGCLQNGGPLMYGKTCYVQCASGYTPKTGATFAYTCNATYGGDVGFDAVPSIQCIPGMIDGCSCLLWA